MAAEIQGSGGATSEIEELRERLVKLEAAKLEAEQPRRVVRRMVELMGGSGVFVPYHGPELGEQLARQQFTGETRNEMARAEAIRAEQAEAFRAVEAADDTPSPPTRPWSYVEMLKAAPGSMTDTRTGLDTPGPSPVDTATIRAVDRIARYHEDLERAEAEKRHRDAFGPAGDTSDG